MIKDKLLQVLVCPKCKGKLTHKKAKNEELHCNECKLAYSVIDDIPNMLIDDARSLKEGK
jgi:hypothetical protein